MKKSTWVIFVSLFVSAISTTVLAAGTGKPLSTEDRLNRLERLVNSKGLVDVMVRVESLQSELQRLVGEIELQKHTLDEIKKRQRDLYLDIDRRILQIERRSGTSSVPVVIPQASRSSTRSNTPAVSGVKASSAAPRVIKKKEGEQVAYQKAFDLLRALRYEKATKAFRQFLTDYPDGRYAHIAQYWLAETSYHTRKYAVAVEDYQTIINQ